MNWTTGSLSRLAASSVPAQSGRSPVVLQGVLWCPAESCRDSSGSSRLRIMPVGNPVFMVMAVSWFCSSAAQRAPAFLTLRFAPGTPLRRAPSTRFRAPSASQLWVLNPSFRRSPSALSSRAETLSWLQCRCTHARESIQDNFAIQIPHSIPFPRQCEIDEENSAWRGRHLVLDRPDGQGQPSTAQVLREASLGPFINSLA